MTGGTIAHTICDFLVGTGVDVAPSTPEELPPIVRSGAARYDKIIKQANIQPQ